MTVEQFDALAALMRLRSGSASSAALRMVLVDGACVQNAAAANLIQSSHVETLLESASKVLERAQKLHGLTVTAAV